MSQFNVKWTTEYVQINFSSSYMTYSPEVCREIYSQCMCECVQYKTRLQIILLHFKNLSC